MTDAPTIAGHVHVRLISSAGGYGDVHLYRDEALDRNVAVKVIRDLDISTSVVQRFFAEANTMAVLEHPNIVRVYGAGRTTDGRPYIAMQYCPAATMEQQATGGRLSLAEVLKTGIGIGSAIETAHRAGVIHRDIKPANILITPWGAPGLTDFGVAAQLAGDTADDEVGVSVPWSPPEMLYTAGQGGRTSDVYSLAATVWHLLVGRSPFELPGAADNGRLALMGRIRDLPPPPTGRPDVPDSLERVLRQGMAKRPEQRFQTMYELVRAFQAVERELGYPVTEATIVDHAGSPGPAEPPAGPGHGAAGETDDGERTMRRPRQAGAAPSGPPTRVDDGLEQQRTQRRARSASVDRAVVPPQEVSERTHLRPRTTEVTVQPGPDPVPSRRSKGLLVAAGVLLVVAAGAVGALLATRGHGTAPPAPVKATVTAQGSLSDTLPAGPAAVTGRRQGASVVFSWTYDNALSTDSFTYEVVGGQAGVAAKPTVTIPAPVGHEVCLHVKVKRADGSDPQLTWSPTACVK